MIALADSSLAYLAWAAVLIVSAVMTALCNGIETGAYVLNKMRLDIRAEGGARPAVALRDLFHGYDLLAVLLVGINVFDYLATFAVTAMFLMAGYDEARAEWYTLLILTPVMFIFCQSLPKAVFQRSAESLVYPLVWMLTLLKKLFTLCLLLPVVRAFAGGMMNLLRIPPHARGLLGHEGFGAIVAEGQASGVLTHAQTVMADRILHIAGIKLANVMIPLAQAVCVNVGVTRDQIREIMARHNFSRVPVLDAARQVVGVLDVYAVLSAEESVAPEATMSPPAVLAAELTIPDALYHIQEAKVEMAVVADPAGRHVGVVTIKDLVEEIVGELEAW